MLGRTPEKSREFILQDLRELIEAVEKNRITEFEIFWDGKSTAIALKENNEAQDHQA